MAIIVLFVHEDAELDKKGNQRDTGRRGAAGKKEVHFGPSPDFVTSRAGV